MNKANKINRINKARRMKHNNKRKAMRISKQLIRKENQNQKCNSKRKSKNVYVPAWMVLHRIHAVQIYAAVVAVIVLVPA